MLHHDSYDVGSTPAGAATEAVGMETLYKSSLFSQEVGLEVSTL